MLSLSDKNQSNVIVAFNSTSRYLDNLLNNDNPLLNKCIKVKYIQLNSS